MTLLALITGVAAGLTLGGIFSRMWGPAPIESVYAGLFGMGIGVVTLTALLIVRGA